MNFPSFNFPDLKNLKKQSLMAGLLLLFIFINLNLYSNKLPLFGEEHRRSIVAQEMMLTGNYIVPTIFQQPYLNKPPLQNWLISAASLPFGEVTAFSARLVSILSFVLIALSMYLFMLKVKPEIAFTALLIVATNYLMLCEYSNMAEPDMLVTLFTFLAYIFYILNPRRFANILVSSIFMGAGILTKGVSPIFFYPGIVAYLFTVKQNRSKMFAFLGLHLVMSLILPAAWAAMYYFQGDTLQLARNFSHELTTRADRSFWQFMVHLFYFPIRVFAVLLPWSLVLWYAFRKQVIKDPAYASSFAIFIISAVIFIAVPGSRDRYLMPAYPFFAIVAAYHIDALKMPSRKFQQIVFGILACGAIGTAVYFVILNYYIQAAMFIVLSVICLRLIGKRFRIIEFATAFVLIFFIFYEHGLYYYRTYDRYNYQSETAELSDYLRQPVPVVVHPSINIRTGLYIEKMRKEPVFRQGLKDFGRYYFVTYPDKLDTTAIEIARTHRPDHPERSLVLQYHEDSN